jgi:hypothetical protein
MSFIVLAVDDEPDVEMLFRQQFGHDLRDKRFRMGFVRITDACQTSSHVSKLPRRDDLSKIRTKYVVVELGCRVIVLHAVDHVLLGVSKAARR